MKKHLFTAVLAIVAVGGVFAMKADTKTLVNEVYNKPDGITCTLVTQCTTLPQEELCSSEVTGPFYGSTSCSTPITAYRID